MNETCIVLSLADGNEIHLARDDDQLQEEWMTLVLRDWIDEIAEESVKREWQVIPTHFYIKFLQFDCSDRKEKDFLLFLKKIGIAAFEDLAESAEVSTFRVIQTLLEVEKQKRAEVDFLVCESGRYVKAWRRVSETV